MHQGKPCKKYYRGSMDSLEEKIAELESKIIVMPIFYDTSALARIRVAFILLNKY